VRAFEQRLRRHGFGRRPHRADGRLAARDVPCTAFRETAVNRRESASSSWAAAFAGSRPATVLSERGVRCRAAREGALSRRARRRVDRSLKTGEPSEMERGFSRASFRQYLQPPRADNGGVDPQLAKLRALHRLSTPRPRRQVASRSPDLPKRTPLKLLALVRAPRPCGSRTSRRSTPSRRSPCCASTSDAPTTSSDGVSAKSYLID